MRKQSITHEDFLKLRISARQIPDTVIEQKITNTVATIQRHCIGKRAAYAWSGGKDAQVLRFLCEIAGVHDCVLGISDLEYPAFLRWVDDHKPERLHVINTGVNLEWLSKREYLLFPQNADDAGRWFQVIQHRAQRDFCRERGIETLLLGRRTADGNFTGKNSMYEKAGVQMVSPISDWTHEDVFAVIDRHQIPLPPFYDWERGYRVGTHCWAARPGCDSQMHGWQEVNAIDPDIPKWAARLLPSAKEFLMTAEV